VVNEHAHLQSIDRVDDYVVFQLLRDKYLPKNFTGTLLDWFLLVCLSFCFNILAGVRQGLSPLAYLVYLSYTWTH